MFYDSPSLQYILRVLPNGAGLEAGLEEIITARPVCITENTSKKRKKSSESALGEGLSAVAKALATILQISFTEKPEEDVFKKYELTNRITDTVQKLMNLERLITGRKQESKFGKIVIILKF